MRIELFQSSHVPAASPSGLVFRGDAIGEAEERQLIHSIDALPLTPFSFQGWLGKRLTTSFGWSYDFETAQVAAAPPMPDWILSIRSRAAAFINLPDDQLVQVLLIRCDPGLASAGTATDRTFEYVVSLSLGTSATLRRRLREESGFQRHGVTLPRRSIYRLTGEARHR